MTEEHKEANEEDLREAHSEKMLLFLEGGSTAGNARGRIEASDQDGQIFVERIHHKQ